jgi:hypothetical protein
MYSYIVKYCISRIIFYDVGPGLPMCPCAKRTGFLKVNTRPKILYVAERKFAN